MFCQISYVIDSLNATGPVNVQSYNTDKAIIDNVVK